MKMKSFSAMILCGLSAAAYLGTQAPAHADPPPGNWTPAFTEDFNSGAVTDNGNPPYNYPILTTGQGNVWDVGFRVGNVQYLGNGDYVRQGYNRNNVTVSGGNLVIALRHENTFNYGMDGGAWGNPLNPGNPSYFYNSSGCITTYQKYTQTYGYFEARIQMPTGAGDWPAFWLLPDRGASSPNVYYETQSGNVWNDGYGNSGTMPTFGDEIDVFEYMATWQSGSSPYLSHSSSALQSPGAGSGSGYPGFPSGQNLFTANNTLVNPNGSFHTYGLYWGPNVLRYYVDGVQVWVNYTNSYVINAPHYMILNVAISANDWVYNSSIPESTIEAGEPTSMLVDYVHTFTGTPTPPASDLALNAVMSSSSSDEGTFSNSPSTNTIYNPWSLGLVVDGQNTSTGASYGWRSNSSLSTNHTEWVEADMGASYPINNVTLYPQTDANHVGAGFPIDFTIQTSTDGTTWATAVTKTAYSNPGSAAQSFTFPSVAARYIKVNGTNLPQDANDSYYYRMAFAEIGATTVANATLGTVATLDPFTAVGGVSYNYWNSYHTSGSPSASDIGTMSGGVWSPTTTGDNTDHFVINNAAVQLVNVGDSVSLAVKTLATDNPAIGIVLSAGLVPSGSVNQDELLLMRTTSGYEIANYTSPSGTTAQTDYSTMTVTETAYNSSTQVRTFSVNVTGGGIAPILTTAYLTGANCYVGLGSFGNNNGMEGASAKNFLITRSSVSPDLVYKGSLWVTSSNESLPLWGQSLLLDGLLNSSALANGWESSSSLTADHTEQLTVDLGTATQMANVTLWPRTDHAGQSFPVNFAIKTSPDGSVWSTQYYPTNYAVPGQAGQSFSFGSTPVRYLDVYGFNLRADPQDSNNYRMAFAEVTATAAQTDFALNGTVTASSTYTTSPWGLTKVVDGQINSSGTSYGWLSNNSLTTNHTEWVQVKLPAVQNYSIVTLYPRTDNPGQSFPINFTIQTSPNGTTWTTVVTRTAFPLPGAVGQGQAFAVPTTNAQYIRVTGTSLRSNPSDSNYYRMGFAEITVN